MEKSLEQLLTKIKKDSEKSFQRRILVIKGTGFKKHELVSEILNFYYENGKILCVIDELKPESTSVKRLEIIKSGLNDSISLVAMEFGKTDKALGKTFDGLVIDFTKDLRADDLGRVIETVRGGGLIVFIVPRFEEFENQWLLIHRYFITPPYEIHDVKPLFTKRMVKFLRSYDGIAIYDFDENRIEKDIKELGLEYKPEKIESKDPVESLCRTKDQLEMLKAVENFINNQRKIMIITADRGRGKTVGLAISLINLIKQGLIKKRVLITAYSYENVSVFFEFFTQVRDVLDSLGMEVQAFKKRIKIKYQDKKIEIVYKKPLDVCERLDCDLVIVDEASSLPTNILNKVLEFHEKVIYSSTTHGYEGCGRGFSVRFIGRLKKKKIPFDEYSLVTPIRYAKDDLIEKWLFDFLLLNAEPDELTEEDIKLIKEKKFKVVIPKKEEFILNQEDKLRSFFGIYILAHYRNSPQDLHILADAPHHDLAYMELENGKVVCSLQIAYEGALDKETSKKITDGYDPSGNLIPSKIGQNYQDDLFPMKKGARVVRIATHPDAQSMGIGSYFLKLYEDKIKKKKLSWFGSSFGSTKDLLRFWSKNGFHLVHITPLKQKTSGEFSVIVLKGLDKKLETVIKKYSFFAKYKFLGSLLDAHRNMELSTALEILESSNYDKDLFEMFGPKISTIELKELEAFVKEAVSYETIYEVIRKLVYMYFLDPSRPNLDTLTKKIIVEKVLKNKKWKFVSEDLKVERKQIVKRIRQFVKDLMDEYMKYIC